jgi:hypothetical protein
VYSCRVGCIMAIYSKIDPSNSNTVVNVQIINPGDYLDPSFTWVDIDGLACIDASPIQIGCTYDGTNFYAAPPDEDS